MYEHHLKDMVKSLKDKGLLQDEDKALQTLKEYWVDKIAITWTSEDLISWSKDHDYKEISEEDARETLKVIFNSHDCTIGITWDTIDYALDSYWQSEEEWEAENAPLEDVPLLQLKYDSAKRILNERLKRTE